MGLTHRQARKWLLLGHLLLLALAGGGVWYALMYPLGTSVSAQTKPRPDGDKNTKQQTAAPIPDLAAKYARPLRKPLFDVVATVKKTPPPPLRITLIGTATDPGYTYAIFRNPTGQQELIEQGQSIGGAKVLKIEQGSVTVLYHNEERKLRVEETP